MSRTILAILVTSCIAELTAAQYRQFGRLGRYEGFRDSEWLMDDPHKADRMPFWNHLLGNRRFMARSRGRTSTRARAGSSNTDRNNFSNNMNWMPFLMNFNFDY